MKTAVLVHGYHLQSPHWEEIEWGNPADGRYGNISKGIVEALRFDADIILFGTGASVRDGMTEGEYAIFFARDRLCEIPACAQKENVQKWFLDRAVAETTSINTESEIRACARIAREREAERLVQVVCRSHAARALNTALRVLKDEPELQMFLPNFCTVVSDAQYEGADAKDVVVIEPPHRPDMQHVPFSDTLQKLVPLMNAPGAHELNDEIARVIDNFKKQS